jgi:hypothetical protein
MQVNKAVGGTSLRAYESQQKANNKEWNKVYSSHQILWINVETYCIRLGRRKRRGLGLERKDQSFKK